MRILKQLIIALPCSSYPLLSAQLGALLGKFIAVRFPHYYPSVFPDTATQPYFDATDVGMGTGFGQGAVAGLFFGAVVVLALAIANRRRDSPS
jgi:hypothetical protein